MLLIHLRELGLEMNSTKLLKNENHSLFFGYAYADYPEVERFNDVSMSSLEAGYTGRF